MDRWKVAAVAVRASCTNVDFQIPSSFITTRPVGHALGKGVDSGQILGLDLGEPAMLRREKGRNANAVQSQLACRGCYQPRTLEQQVLFRDLSSP